MILYVCLSVYPNLHTPIRINTHTHTHTHTHTQIELQHLGMVSPVHPHVHPPATRTSEIHYLCVVEEEDFHVGVFVLPPKARIPLHDHPGMCVLSRLLCGSLNVKDFDWCDAPSPPEQAGGGCRGRRKAQTGRQTHAQTQTERRKGSEGNDEEDDNKEGGEGHIHTHAQARKQSNYDTSSSPRLRRLRGFAKLTSSAWITRPTTLSLFKVCMCVCVCVCVSVCGGGGVCVKRERDTHTDRQAIIT